MVRMRHGAHSRRTARVNVPDHLEQRLRRLEGAEAIRKLIAIYAIGADRKNDPAILGPLFSSDAVWEADGLTRLVGRQAIADGLAELAHSFVSWSLHYMVSPLIDIDAVAGSATCRWYLPAGMKDRS